ncbi:uncharacterized protein LOC142955430 [Anarhichas minor]|uniref:uncharacterized protein LOC142955430 n=1 Tax=Anarhichas minor TaxID=65739 RepID=UPI003F73A0F6
METHTKTQRPNNGQLIYVPHKDTIRLLEVYVKRSLSLNDGALGSKRAGGKEKWVTMPRKMRRHSSDPSFHLADEPNDEVIGTFSPVEPIADQPETRPEESEKPVKKPKKNKKPSLWKSFLDIFSPKVNEEKDQERDSPPEIPKSPSASDASDAVTTCLPTITVNKQKRKSKRRKSLRRRFSERRQSMKKPKDFNHDDITRVEAVSVEPTYFYYEKVSEELEKIIHEVQEKEEAAPLSDEEVIDRIIALTKEEGDAIDDKLKDNPTLSNFFKGMSYSSFQKLADAYLETEASPTHNPPTVLPTAPELVKLAFTLDFTARIVGLSKQHIGHITGLGNRYLHDRFEYQQACSDHPGSNSDD